MWAQGTGSSVEWGSGVVVFLLGGSEYGVDAQGSGLSPVRRGRGSGEGGSSWGLQAGHTGSSPSLGRSILLEAGLTVGSVSQGAGGGVVYVLRKINLQHHVGGGQGADLRQES